MPKVSICIPIYNMDNAEEFLKRNLDSVMKQTFTDYEIVISDDSEDDLLKCWLDDYPVKYFKNLGQKGMANNTNNAIEQAKGELIKILYQDDYFYDENSLQEIIRGFSKNVDWLVTGCIHEVDGRRMNPHQPFYSENENTIGSPSVLTFRNTIRQRFDLEFYWVLDLDFYKQLFRRYGLPKILPTINVVIGLGEHQSTNKLSEQRKILEHQLLKNKYNESI